MRMTLAILSFLLFGPMGCSDESVEDPPSDDAQPSPVFDDDPSITTLNGVWKVYCFENLDSHAVEFKTHENSRGEDIIVEFDDTRVPYGFGGTNTTNSFNGTFAYVGSREFKLGGIITTLVGQPEWGDEFSRFMRYAQDRKVPFEISSDMLRIYYQYNRKTVTLVKE